jgi:beta-phosphoglucomutase
MVKRMDNTKCIAALFDFDGVVMDTETQYSLFWNKIGKQYFPQIEEFGRIIKGQTLVNIYAKYFAGMEKEQQDITARLNQFEKDMAYEYIPGVVDFMKDLRAHGVKMAIVTSSNDLKMANVYKAHPELKELVDRILTAEMFTRSKPAPDCFLLGAEVFGTVPQNCVVFEDSFHGLEAGNAAGMAVVGLCTTNPKEAIADKCKLVIPDFTAFSFEKMKALLA